MTKYQILTCPNCNGAGCPTCQNTGKVRVTKDQLKKLKTMVDQMPKSISQSTATATNQTDPYAIFKKIRFKTNLAGIIAFSFLSILAGGAAASWYFLKNLKPFFAALISLFTAAGTALAWKHPWFQMEQPKDFLTAINKKG